MLDVADGGGCPICQKTLELFVHLYGAEAGNLALKLMSTAGIYLGGGVAPRNIEQFNNSIFMDGFASKGRMKEMLQEIPVKIILNQKTALYGPAVFAGSKI